MAEIGLVRFARVALEVAEAVLPDYPTKFSPSTPSPRAATFGHSLPYIRYEEWTPCVKPRFGWPSTASCETL